MPSASTCRTLGRRAVFTANWLEVWAEKLTKEAQSQDIDLWRKHGGIGELRKSEPAVMLTQHMMRDLIGQMSEKAREIRRFSN